MCPLSALALLQVGLHQLLRVSAARHRGEDVPVQNIASPYPVSSPASGQAPSPEHGVTHRCVRVHLHQHALGEPGALGGGGLEVDQSVVISALLHGRCDSEVSHYESSQRTFFEVSQSLRRPLLTKYSFLLWLKLFHI